MGSPSRVSPSAKEDSGSRILNSSKMSLFVVHMKSNTLVPPQMVVRPILPRLGIRNLISLCEPGLLQRIVGKRTAPHRSRCERNRRYSSTDASISDFRMETLSTLMPIGKRFSRA